jgi:hypothetical protein
MGACVMMGEVCEGFGLTDAGDFAALAGAMGRLMDKEFRAGMARACLELRPALAYEKHVQRLLQIYESVIEGKVR